ncbi:hypothetical protein EVAR_37832_1 [Eumeta japonica]|uniref:Uncharacterized protein n=1 Tax=Eumeta variegata TaxID=151549 RepID=A0A4C1X1W2_EUMVA|nr:hypothetical protein EVAR_37832_1 [Eumeta japonica]
MPVETLSTSETLSPIRHGYEEDNRKYVPLWYTSNQLPSSADYVTITDNLENDSVRTRPGPFPAAADARAHQLELEGLL